jgi:ribA/ribD-fused uncharacterized protein
MKELTIFDPDPDHTFLRTRPITSFEGEYRFLSNFYPTQVTYNNITYPSSEHAYQAQKSGNSRVHKIFAKLETAAEAKTLGHALKPRADWDQMKQLVMFNIVKLKFDSNPKLKEMLLATGDREIIEGNTWNDTYWGVCDGVGENHLGKILMLIRTNYRSELFS